MPRAIDEQNGTRSRLRNEWPRGIPAAIFRPEDGIGQLPLRGELFSLDHLRTHAVNLASSLQTHLAIPKSQSFHQRVEENGRVLKFVHQSIASAVSAGEPLGPDAEWLLDNFYVVEEQLREIADDLPPGYYRELPKLADGQPRIYCLAEELIVHTDSALDPEAVTAFVNEFQTVAQLTIGEVWALPIMFRLALVENLRRLAVQLLVIRQHRAEARARAEAWSQGDQRLEQLLGTNAPPQLIAQLVMHLGELDREEAALFLPVEQAIAERFPSAQDFIHDEYRRQAANQVSIGNVITSMRLISALDWVEFFEQTNLAERALRRDPAGVYPLMDFETRDRYRHAVEDIAKRSGYTDILIAELVVTRAQSAIGIDLPGTTRVPTKNYQAHVGYWLVDEGRTAFEESVCYQPKPGERPRRWMRRHPSLTYFGGLALFATIGVAWIALVAWLAGASPRMTAVIAVIGLWPVSEWVLSLVNLLVTRRLRPWQLPKLELREGVPAEFATMVVVPALLTSRKEIHGLLERLEMHYVANPEPALRFALLTDFTDGTAQQMPQDQELLDCAIAGIRNLNARHGTTQRQPFYLFHRSRQWNRCEQAWMGWERKRGKLAEFNRLLLGDTVTSYVVREGDLAALFDANGRAREQFVITLDADTQLPMGAARRLIGTLAHPLNFPQMHPSGRCVMHGYSIIQPRIGVPLSEGHRSRFAQIFANSRGIDPYATAASDVYQDLFGEGSFTGKGIYHVETFERTLQDAFAENQILSHDLIEGCHARVGLASDIELIDGYPARYDAEARRMHRWVRGDWQILPWLFQRVTKAYGRGDNHLSLLSRWKIFDNLRRSLVPPMTFLLLIVGWFILPGSAWWWSACALLTIGFPTIAGLFTALWDWPRNGNWRGHLTSMANDLGRSALQTAITAACLPHRALVMVDAIARTLVRMTITRRRLLEWETAVDAERRLSQHRWSMIWRMWFLPVIAIAMAILLPRQALTAAVPWLVAWFVAPGVAQWISQPRAPRRKSVTEDDRRWLRLMARKTWAYYENTISPATNWLPPDNLQEYPREKLAERISPTNEGLYLVAILVARDFGYLGLHDLLERWERNLDVWSRLPKMRGHFYNWYDTGTLQPLIPRYLSTVDSGNLAASLIVIRQAAEELARRPILSAGLWSGLEDALDNTLEACANLQPRGAHLVSPPLDDLTTMLEQLRQVTAPGTDRWSDWSRSLAHLRTVRTTLSERLQVLIESRRHPSKDVVAGVQTVLGWIDAVDRDFSQLFAWTDSIPAWLGKPSVNDHHVVNERGESFGTVTKRLHTRFDQVRSVNDLASLPADVAADLKSLETIVGDTAASGGVAAFMMALEAAARAATEVRHRLEEFGHRAEQMALEMDFRFLYNPQRRLFAIGYNLEEGVLDRAHYDLLCSEARLSSHFAIAKGDVAPRHWFQMGRQMTVTAGRPGLLSWGGTMFEFLMPLLFQRNYEGSLLSDACETAVVRQEEYGRQRKIPWGMSESAFAAVAVNSDYHYQSFGVPGLGLKRGLSEDQVVAPYASMLALAIDPVASVANLRRLTSEGALGKYGFYDAIDYTPLRIPAGKPALPVQCFMAHHQAMSLLAMANLLFDQTIEKLFHSHPLIRATDLLLQERMPLSAPVVQPHTDEIVEVRTARPEDVMVSRRLIDYDTVTPRTHLLSNGAYSVMVTNTGGGYSQWNDVAVTRWRSDTTSDPWGQFLYLRDIQDPKHVWSPTYRPTCSLPDRYEILYSIDKAEYRRTEGELETHLEIAVCPENQVELRLLRITNQGQKSRRIELTSYAELAMIATAADAAHPAFHKLFIETEYIPEEMALLARRRPRDAEQPALWGLHVLSCTDEFGDSVQFESSRQQFLGRGRDLQHPAAMDPGARLSGTTGLVLDPILSLRCTVAIHPQSSVTLAWTTGVASTREEAMRLVDQFHDLRGVLRSFELAWAFNQVRLHHIHLTAMQAQRYQQLASFLLYPHGSARGSERALRANRLGQSGLWRFGISGDQPILLLTIADSNQADFVQELLSAREYWQMHGLKCDLVILNTHPGSYIDALQEQLQHLVEKTPRVAPDKANAVYLLRASHLGQVDLDLLETAAAVVMDAKRGWGGLPQQTSRAPTAVPGSPFKSGSRERLPAEERNGRAAFSLSRGGKPAAIAPPQRVLSATSTQAAEPVEFANGLGGFVHDGREYQLRLTHSETSPMPWSNVIANPRLGCLITESGGGFTWMQNSRENKLTTWANDPVADPPSEMLYLRDEETQTWWAPLSRPEQEQTEQWVRHGQGASRFLQTTHGLSQTVTVSVAPEDPVKLILVSLKNTGDTPRHLSATYYVEWVLGVTREQTRLHLVTESDPAAMAVLARNSYHPEYPEQWAFLRVIGHNATFTADRQSFLGRNRDIERPLAMEQSQLSEHCGVGYDPCGAVQTRFDLNPGASIEVAFILGCGADRAEASGLLQKYATLEAAHQAIDGARQQWDDILQTIQVKTPNRALDVLMNRWLVYQTLSCRMWGRSAYYQSGGAYGFRDQLQDAMALVYSRPQLVREHILRAAQRQYEEGDVQHWWHPPTGRGTRTRFSDDLLFLPFTVAHYISVTGDVAILDEDLPFLRSPLLEPHEHERYELPHVSTETGTLYEHCRRAIARGFRTGEHGLPLMGCGDWNDGMNKVGAHGRGESVWVGWFLLVLLDRFLPLMDARDDTITATDYRHRADALRAALEEHAWDGEWYRRAYFDDGTPLGSHLNDECQIDSLAQSWAVMAGAPTHRTDRAMAAALKRLVFPTARLVALFDPPFDRTALDPGYIKGYLPGVRENGGQYTHAVLWLIQALAMQGNAEEAMKLFDMINPIHHTETAAGVRTYQVEPYVMAADVYSVAPHTGRGGWTWYTGSASWTYRVALESLLGLQVQPEGISFTPCVPKEWGSFEVSVRVGASTWQFTILLDGPDSAAIDSTAFDSIHAIGTVIPVTDDQQTHRVLIQPADCLPTGALTKHFQPVTV